MSLARSTQPTRGSESESHADADLELLAKTEHLHAVYKHALLVLLANLAGSATLTAGLWTVAQDRLMAWLVVLLLFNVSRWLQARRQAAKPPEAADLPKLELRLLLGTLASGLLWGSAAVLFYVPNQPAHSMFLTLILVAMTAGSTALLSFHRLAYPVFCTPVVLPLAIQLGT